MTQADSSNHDHLPNSRVRDAAWRLRKINFKIVYRNTGSKLCHFQGSSETIERHPKASKLHLNQL